VKAGFTLTNLSTRTLHLTLAVRTQDEGAAAVDFKLRPSRLRLARGHSVLVHLSAITASEPSGSATSDGAVVVGIAGGGGIRVPWAIAFGPNDLDLIGGATLSAESFAPSDTKPTLLALDVGRVLDVVGRPEIRPVRELDVSLFGSNGASLGTLVRLRDVLPGRYTFGLTGRGPDGQLLPPGDYVLHVVAYPAEPGPPSRRRLQFTLR
jgi:hypothetical protein